MLGIEMRDLTKEDAEALGLDEPVGVMVLKANPGSPAEKSGFQPGDVILTIDGVETKGMEAFRATVGNKGADATVRFRVLRAGRQRTLTATLAARGAEPSEPRIESPLRLMLDTGGHQAVLKDIIWTKDGRQIISAGDDKVIRVWDAETGRTLRTIRGQIGPGNEGKIFAMSLSPDEKWLAVGGFLGPYLGTGDGQDEPAHQIRIYDFASGKLITLLKGHENVVFGLAFSSGENGDRLKLISGSYDRTAIVWDMKTAIDAAEAEAAGRPAPRSAIVQRLTGHTGDIYAVGFLPDGRRAVTGSFDKTVRLWDVTSGRMIGQPWTGHTDFIFALAVNPSNGTVATGSFDGEVRLWDPNAAIQAQSGAKAAPKVLLQRTKVANQVGAMVYNPSGTQLIVGTSGPFGPWPAYTLDASSLRDLTRFMPHENIIVAAATSPDGRWVATGDFLGKVRIWSATTGEPRRGRDGQPFVLAGAGAPVWAVGFGQDGQSIAWGSTNANPMGSTPINNRGRLEARLRLPVAGLSLGQPERPPNGDQGFSRAIDSHGDMTLAHRAGGREGQTRHEGILGIYRKGTLLTSITRGSVDGYVHRSYSFSVEGKTVLSGGDGGHMMAYDLEGNALAQFVGHESEVWAIAPSPDGRYLVSGSADQTVRIWPLGPLKDADVQPTPADGRLPPKIIAPIATLYNGRDGQWVLWTPEGYYTGSEEADKLIGWQLNAGAARTPEFFAAHQLRQQFNRRDIVEKAIVLASSDEAIRQSNGTSYKVDDLIRRPPPRLVITQPKSFQQLTGGQALVTVRIDATPDPVKRITVRVNGRVIAEQTPDRAEGEFEFRVPIANGQNLITVVAGNDVGDTPAEVRVSHSGNGLLDQRGTLYVVAIGVDRYPSLRCGPQRDQSCDLTWSSRDATVFADTISAAMGPAHTNVDLALLSNGPGATPPTASNVRRALSRARNLAKETDTLVVFTAGHGLNDGFDYLFLTTDATRQGSGFDGSSVLPWTELERIVFGTKGRRFLFVDTCHSAGAFNVKLGREALYNDVTAFTATGQDEEAIELTALQQGVFTYTLRRALMEERALAAERSERVVRVSTLAQFLQTKTDQLISQHWPTFEQDKGQRRPSPKVYRARDAVDHVLTTLN
jgi:WD40 repeat protein/uncharacterized caspase-like protein